MAESEYRRRPPKKPEHPIREWISDYLRYFMLIGGILIILLIAFLVIRLISSKENPSSSEQAVTVSSVSELTAASVSDTADSSEDTDLTAAPAATAEPTAEPAEEISQEEAESDVTTLVYTYFTGLTQRDADQVASCVDALSDEDRQQVQDNTSVSSYNNVIVYTCPGTDDSSKVLFVTYDYVLSGSDTEIPAVTEFYAYKNESGQWVLASDTTDAAIQAKMQAAEQTDTAETLIQTVQDEYDQVMAEHPELAG